MEHIPLKEDAGCRQPVFSPAVVCASCLYAGYLPLIPGTFASLAVLIWFLAFNPGPAALGIVALAATAMGFLCAGRAEKTLGKKDPRVIVIDEIAGMSLSLLFIPHHLWFALAAFFAFRVLDTVKPYPAARLQDLHGSVGIMLDDIVAAGYTVIVMQTVLRVLLRLPV